MGKFGINSVSACSSMLWTHLDAAPTSEQELRGSCQGFTLVELIIALLIVATLTAIAVPLYGDYIYKANLAAAVTEIRALEKEIIFYRTERGVYPGWDPMGTAGVQTWSQPLVPMPLPSSTRMVNLKPCRHGA